MPNDMPSTVPSSLPSMNPSAVPSSVPTLSFPSSNPTLHSSFDPTLVPSKAPSNNPSSGPSLIPSSESDELPDIVQVTMSSVLKIDNVTLPEDPEDRHVLAQVLEQTISNMLNGEENTDVIVRAINDIAINVSAPAKAVPALRDSNDLKVDFDIVKEVECEDTCDDVIESVGSIANQTTVSFAQSLENGAFLDSLVSNAANSNVSSFDNATVSAEDFSSDEPVVEVVTPAPTSTEPSLTPSAEGELGQCDHEHHMILILKTDGYAFETSWNLAKDDGTDNFVDIDGGSGYKPLKEYILHRCLSEGCYIFTIYDSYGDGLCCEYGEGSYELLLDDISLTVGASFEDFEATAFCAIPSSSPTTEPSVAPSGLSSLPPSPMPSLEPTWLSSQPSVDSGSTTPSNSMQPSIQAGETPDEKMLILFLRMLVAFIDNFLSLVSKNVGKLFE